MVALHLLVRDVPGSVEWYQQALNASVTRLVRLPDGSIAIRRLAAPEDKFWGVRTGEVLDPSGHRWAFDQKLRDVADGEIEARIAALVDGE